MLNRTVLWKILKILLNIRTADISLNYLGKMKNIPDNFVPPRSRLLSLLERLSKHSEQLKCYDTIIKEQERDGVIEPVDNPKVIRHGEVHSIPRREVVKEERETTKLRIVYDASANQNGPSINESLHSGPSLLPKIFDILVRFRSYKYAIISDIQSAFLNIRVAEEDRDFLRFLWVKDIVQKDFELVVNSFTSVMFGLTYSPSLLSMTVRLHVLKYLNLNEDLVMKF